MCSLVKHIKVVLCIVILCTLCIVINKSYAQDIGATVNVVKTGSASLFVNVKRVSDNTPQPDDQVRWNVNVNQDGWKIADQYLEVSFANVPEFWGIQIYTDNKNLSANPKFTGEGNPAGLVDVNRTTTALPLAWLVTDHVLTEAERNSADYLPVERSGAEGFTNYLWHYLVDKNTKDDPKTFLNESFDNAKDYIALWNQLGIAWNEGGRAKKPGAAYIYLASKFSVTYAGASYRTSTLTFELYHGVNPFPLYVYKDADISRKVEYTDNISGFSANPKPNAYRTSIEVLGYDVSANFGNSIHFKAKAVNIGTVTWTRNEFRLRAHGYLPDGTPIRDLNAVNPASYNLTANVPPGGIALFEFDIPTGPSAQMNQTGICRIGLDMVWEGNFWFGHEQQATVEILPQGKKSIGGFPNHYIPAYMNYNNNPANPNISVDYACTDNLHTGNYCLKVKWTGENIPRKGPWAGVMWLEPEPFDIDGDGKKDWVSGPGYGYDLRGVTHLSFWARTDPKYFDPDPAKISKISIFFGLDPQPGDPQGLSTGDSCQRTPPYDLWIPLTTSWQYWLLPVSLSTTKDMSHVSGGFGVVFNDEHDGVPDSSPGYTVYLDDIRFLAPEPLLQDFTFTPGTEGWQFDNTQAVSYGMNPARGFYDSVRGCLAIDGNTSQPQPKYGIWYYNHPGNNIPIEANRLYKAVFTVGTNVTAAQRQTVPHFRLITHSNNFQVGTTTDIQSTGTGSSSPASGADKTYEVYFTVPSGSTENQMALAFDYVNTNTTFDPNSSTAAVDLKNVTIKEAINVIVAKEMRRFTFDSSTEDWQFDNSEASGYGMNPARGFRNAAVGSLRIDGYNPTTPDGQPVLLQPKYGKWYYNILGSNIRIEPNRLYKAVFTVGTDQQDPSLVPMFRLITHSMDSSAFIKGFQVGTTTSVSSMGDGLSCPSSGNDKTYEVYFTIPQGSTQNEMAFTFDYVNTNTPGVDENSSTAAVDLKEVVIYEVYRDAL